MKRNQCMKALVYRCMADTRAEEQQCKYYEAIWYGGCRFAGKFPFYCSNPKAHKTAKDQQKWEEGNK